MQLFHPASWYCDVVACNGNLGAGCVEGKMMNVFFGGKFANSAWGPMFWIRRDEERREEGRVRKGEERERRGGEDYGTGEMREREEGNVWRTKIIRSVHSCVKLEMHTPISRKHWWTVCGDILRVWVRKTPKMLKNNECKHQNIVISRQQQLTRNTFLLVQCSENEMFTLGLRTDLIWCRVFWWVFAGEYLLRYKVGWEWRGDGKWTVLPVWQTPLVWPRY